MRNLKIAAGLLICSLLLNQKTKAQSTAYFYNENQSQRTVAALDPAGPPQYVASETIFNGAGPGGNAVHVMFYSTPPLMAAPLIEISEPGIDTRNVAIVRLSSTQFVQVSYYQILGTTALGIRLTKMDITGAILGSKLIRSTNATFSGLVAMDAVYDANTNRIGICGMAVNGTNVARSGTKAAFVITVDPNLNLFATHVYNSNSGSGLNSDDDIANRIVVTSGGYYVTGSENIAKGTAFHMGIRNMLIDPITLNIIWSVPLGLQTQDDENSVDMIQDGTGDFITLVNFTQANTWGIIRVNPNSGTPTTTMIEQSWEAQEYAHTISLGNLAHEFVVSGMKHRTLTPCLTYDQNADPFMATLNVSVNPATLVMKNEYLTAVGTFTAGINYWTLGGVYSPQASGYPLPIYANRFADRMTTTSSYNVLAPILSSSSAPKLNTKSIFVDAATNTTCPSSSCANPMLQSYTISMPAPVLTNATGPAATPSPAPVIVAYPYTGTNTCPAYYKPTGIEEIQLEGNAVNISPNPANNSFNITLGNAYHNKKTQIALCDVTGKRIATIFDGTTGSDKISYTIPYFITNGMYFVQILSEGNNSKTEKVVIAR